MTEPTTEEILSELISTITIQNAELEELKAQTAKQTDTLNEVKRHGEAVRKSVSWDKLGDHVFQGVAAGVIAEQKKLLQATEIIKQHSSKIQSGHQAVLSELAERLKLSELLRRSSKDNEYATERAVRAAESVTKARKRDWLQSLSMSTLAAVVALFGGYWWAAGSFEKASLGKLGETFLKASGERNCGWAGGEVRTHGGDGIHCAILIKPRTQDP